MLRKRKMFELPQQEAEEGRERLREVGILDGSSTTPAGGRKAYVVFSCLGNVQEVVGHCYVTFGPQRNIFHRRGKRTLHLPGPSGVC